jgi:protein SCO1/2
MRGLGTAALVYAVTASLLLLGAMGAAWAQVGGGGPPATAHPEGSSPVHGTEDCLPNVTLVDQHGRKVSLASLKGRLVLMNFIDTACAARCAPLTATLAYVGNKLRRDLGKTIFFVSISSDPERDSPARLLKFARAIGSEHPGWFFLTGTPAQVDRAMEPFGLRRFPGEQSGWGSLATFAYLLDRNGRVMRIYDLGRVRAESLAFDLFRLLPEGDAQ